MKLYLSYIILISLFALFQSCQSETKSQDVAAKETIDTLGPIMDSLGFSPYLKELVREGRIKQFEFLNYSTGDTSLTQNDSLFQALEKYPWCLFATRWGYNQLESSIVVYPIDSTKVKIDFKVFLIQYKELSKQLNEEQTDRLVNLIKPISESEYDINYADEMLKCGGTLMIYYDGKHFNCFSDYYGQNTDTIMLSLYKYFQ